jgi:hypothetical protein
MKESHKKAHKEHKCICSFVPFVAIHFVPFVITHLEASYEFTS